MALPTAAKQVGLAKIVGLTGTLTITVFTNLSFQPQKVGLTGKADIKKTKDNIGFTGNIYAVDDLVEAEFDFEITADTVAHAQASGVILSSLTKITMGGFDVSALNGDWLYMSDQKINLASGEAGTMTLPLTKWTNATQNTALTTAAA